MKSCLESAMTVTQLIKKGQKQTRALSARYVARTLVVIAQRIMLKTERSSKYVGTVLMIATLLVALVSMLGVKLMYTAKVAAKIFALAVRQSLSCLRLSVAGRVTDIRLLTRVTIATTVLQEKMISTSYVIHAEKNYVERVQCMMKLLINIPV